ncbi:hypothetical protein C7972_1298 [Arenibacter sp. ARW7G5Y1]|nr:hypothetical protein C7972_1298 [Arenibacter sp. ARW7G5Y1]
MTLPGMTALSEVFWSPQKTRNWSDFKNRLKDMSKRYDVMGINYPKHVLVED